MAFQHRNIVHHSSQGKVAINRLAEPAKASSCWTRRRHERRSTEEEVAIHACMHTILNEVANAASDIMSAEAISLYRQILRAAKLLPTELRQLHVARKARKEFEEARHADPSQQQFLLALADTQIDNIRAQAQHLQRLVDTGKLKW